MKRVLLRRTRAVILAGLLSGPAHADTTGELLRAGAYEVDVRLEIPNVVNWSAHKTETICVSDAPVTTHAPLPVLSDNNPFEECPSRNVRRDGRTLRFDIICEGFNMAKARADYTLSADRFEGRIFIVLGAKNMTMTEVQAGRRVGACGPAATTRE
jgi:hypothetical protein